MTLVFHSFRTNLCRRAAVVVSMFQCFNVSMFQCFNVSMFQLICKNFAWRHVIQSSHTATRISVCCLVLVCSLSMLISIPSFLLSLSDNGVGDQTPAPLLLLVFYPSAAASLLLVLLLPLFYVGDAATPAAAAAAAAFSFKTSTI